MIQHQRGQGSAQGASLLFFVLFFVATFLF